MKKILWTLLLFSGILNVPGQAQSSEKPAGNSDLTNYTFVAPEKWVTRNEKDYILLAQSHSNEPGCIILIFPLQPSSGDLEQDAMNVFNQMYPGWQFRSNGEKQYDLSKGKTFQGLEYCMMEAPMSKLSADGSRYDGFEDGSALVIKSGNQIVIIAARHTTMMAHADCLNKYETWRRFFNSFALKNAVAAKPSPGQSAGKIVGVWQLTGTGPSAGEYVFAANGNYQFAGGLGTSSTTTDQRYEYLHIKTYAFQGDGAYSLQGDQLLLRRRADKAPEKVQFRFEQVNHGNTGWNDRLYMLKTDPTLGSKYEVCYERKKR